MNPSDLTTAHYLASLIVLAVAVILLFHFIGFRVVFSAGRPA